MFASIAHLPIETKRAFNARSIISDAVGRIRISNPPFPITFGVNETELSIWFKFHLPHPVAGIPVTFNRVERFTTAEVENNPDARYWRDQFIRIISREITGIIKECVKIEDDGKGTP